MGDAPSHTQSMREPTLRAAGWGLVESVGGQCISFAVFLVMARLLSREDFGTVALANIYVAFAQVLIFQGLGQAIIQKAELQREDLEAAFWINLFFGFLLSVITWICSAAVARWFHSPSLADLLRWLSAIFVLSALADVQTNLLARKFAYKSLALRTGVAFSCGGLVGIGMALSGCGMWSLAGQQLTIGVLNVVLLWGASEWRPHWRFSPTHAREMWRFGSRLMGHEFVSLASRRSDQLFVGKYLGVTAVGIYAIAARVSTMLNEIVVRSIARVNLGSLSRLQAEPQRMASGFYRIVQMQVCLILPLAVGLGLFAREVVLLTVGPHWMSAVPVMRILLLAIPFEALSAINASTMIARGKPGWVSMLTCGHAVLNIGLFAVCARWGLVAVAMAFVARAAFLYPLELLFLRKILPVTLSHLGGLFLPPLCAIIVMVLADVLLLSFLPPMTPALLVVPCAALVSAASYCAALALLQRSLLWEIWGCLQLLRSRPLTS